MRDRKYRFRLNDVESHAFLRESNPRVFPLSVWRARRFPRNLVFTSMLYLRPAISFERATPFYVTFYYSQLGIYMSTHKIEATFIRIHHRRCHFILGFSSSSPPSCQSVTDRTFLSPHAYLYSHRKVPYCAPSQ